MRIKSLSTILKKAELQVPEECLQRESIINHVPPKKETDVMDESDAINLNNIGDDDDGPESLQEGDINHQLNYWDCMMPWDGFCINDQEAGDGYQGNYFENEKPTSMVEDNRQLSIKKEAEFAVLEDDDKKPSLNLSLNYQEVLDAWSDRTLWADDSSFLTVNNAYMGEVPVVEGERKRREASVLRYKEKRQTRLFSKKIRYQVRKLNADKRPRLKGRFVKRVAEKILK